MSRWIYEFNARSPFDPETKEWKVGIQENHFRRLQRNGHAVALARLILVQHVLSDTLAIYKGWNRPNTEECFIYVGKPDFDCRKLPDHHGGEIGTPPPDGCLFLVFVLMDGTIEYWCWRPEAESSGSPEGVGDVVVWRKPT